METRKHIFTVDSHTMGEPTRTVVGGIGPVPGNSIHEKRCYLARHLDHIRTALMHEPRGHQDMFGAIILDPVDPAAKLGVVFMDSSGYLDMCGHGTFGVITTAVEMGLIEVGESPVDLILETPAGNVTFSVEMENRNIKNITIQNVPAFLYRTGVPVTITGWGRILVDIAYGGNFFALVEAADLKLELSVKRIRDITAIGMAILAELKHSLPIKHPTIEGTHQVKLVEFYGPSAKDDADARNVVVFGNGQVDRSPCGTGTCAQMASRFAKGTLGLHQEFVHESIIGTRFQSRLVKQIRLGSYTAVIPEITGRAFLTGIQQFIIDPADPLKHGFQLK